MDQGATESSLIHSLTRMVLTAWLGLRFASAANDALSEIQSAVAAGALQITTSEAAGARRNVSRSSRCCPEAQSAPDLHPDIHRACRSVAARSRSHIQKP